MNEPVPRVLADLHALAADPSLGTGARWKLAEPERQLDANLVHLPAGGHIGTHLEPDLDVVLVVVAGDGIFGTADGPQHVAAGNLVWLPHGSGRDLTAGAAGLSYLTVHRRRPGLQIKPGPPGA
jgi:quercetin dioxygenase-like cupin family protein